jgi:ATP-dependent DNA helicase HFM1/MER3
VRILYIVIPLLTRLQLLNRRPPFGFEVLASVAEFPLYSLSVKVKDIFSDGANPVQVHFLVKCGLVDKVSPLIKPKKQNPHAMSITVVLTLTSESDMDMIDFQCIPSIINLHYIYANTYRRIL